MQSMRDESPVAQEEVRTAWFLRCVLCGQRDERRSWADPDDAEAHEVECAACGASVFSLVEGMPV